MHEGLRCNQQYVCSQGSKSSRVYRRVHRMMAVVMGIDEPDERATGHGDDGDDGGMGGDLAAQPARSRAATTRARNNGLSRFLRQSLLGSLVSL